MTMYVPHEKNHATSMSVVAQPVPLLIPAVRAIYSKVNLVLDDAIEFTPDEENADKFVKKALKCEILLNGNQIAALVPGGAGPDEAFISRTEG